MADQTEATTPTTPEGGVVPPPPPPPPADSSEGEQQTGTQAAPAPEGAKAGRPYSLFRTVTLDLSSASARKEAAEFLASLAHEGQLTVLARVGKVPNAADPKKAVQELGQAIELDGSYEVIADNAVNHFDNVKTKREVTVQIG